LSGKAFNNYRKIFFFSWSRTDIPEKQRSEKKREKLQAWPPQYDLKNSPSMVNTNTAGI